MKTTKYQIVFASLIFLLLLACKKEDDDGKELSINFKTSAGYTYSNETLLPDSSLKIGVIASTTKSKDPIVSFNISESLNGAAATSVYSERFSLTNYEHDYAFRLDTTSGNVHRYVFTITNKDGKSKQTALELTVQ